MKVGRLNKIFRSEGCAPKSDEGGLLRATILRKPINGLTTAIKLNHIPYLIYLKTLFLSHKRWAKLVLWLFLGGIIAGLTYAFFDVSLLKTIINSFQDKLGNLPPGWPLVFAIFWQNLQVAAFCLFGGLIFGVLPIGIVVMNGFILGYVVTIFFRLLPVNFYFKIALVSLTLLPHGIFELPAIFISAALGIKLGLNWMSRGAAGQRKKIFKQDLFDAIKILPLIILVLFLAAVIEVFVSGKLGAILAS